MISFVFTRFCLAVHHAVNFDLTVIIGIRSEPSCACPSIMLVLCSDGVVKAASHQAELCSQWAGMCSSGPWMSSKTPYPSSCVFGATPYENLSPLTGICQASSLME